MGCGILFVELLCEKVVGRHRKRKAASRREWTGVAMDESARRHTRSVAMVNGAETRVAEVRSDQRSASMRRCGDGSGDGGGGAASKAKAGGKRIQE